MVIMILTIQGFVICHNLDYDDEHDDDDHHNDDNADVEDNYGYDHDEDDDDDDPGSCGPTSHPERKH